MSGENAGPRATGRHNQESQPKEARKALDARITRYLETLSAEGFFEHEATRTVVDVTLSADELAVDSSFAKLVTGPMQKVFSDRNIRGTLGIGGFRMRYSFPDEGDDFELRFDGTLIATDLLWEGLFLLLRKNPLFLFMVPLWVLQGPARLKQEIAARVDIDPALLPYRASVVQRLKDERAAGRQIILATGTPRKFAEAIAAYNQVILNYPATNSVPTAYYKRGLAQQQLGQIDAARASWETVAKSFPDSDEGRLAKQNLARLGTKP